MDITFLTTIRELAQAGKISSRSYNICLSNGIETIHDLDTAYTPEGGFRSLRRCGSKSDQELTALIQLLAEIPTEELASGYVRAMPGMVMEAFEKAIQENVDPESSDASSAVFHKLFTLDTFICKVYREKEALLRVVDSIPMDEFSNSNEDSEVAIIKFKIRQLFVKIISTVVDSLTGIFDPEIRKERTFLKKIHQRISIALQTEYVDSYYQTLLTPEKLALAENEYERLTQSCPKVVQNFIQKKKLTLNEAWRYLNIPEADFNKKYPTSQRSAHGYIEILRNFKKFILNLSISTPEEDRRRKICQLFNYLKEDEIDTVLAFKKRHGHYPMFYIADRYFVDTDIRQHEIYAYCFGLGDKQAQRKTEVADMIGVSRERVRQIITSTDFSKTPFFSKEYWEAYPFLDSHFFSSRSRHWARVMDEELQKVDFTAFAGIMVAVFGYSYKRLAGVDKFIVSPHLLPVYGEYLKKMIDLRDRTHADNKLISLTDFLSPEDYADESIRGTVLRELTGYLEIDSIGENLYFPLNTIDTAAEVEKMLRKDGRPIHIDEILERMNASFPELNLTRERLKFHIRSNDEVVPRGKTSYYCLKSWTHIFTGSIRDLVKRTLEERDEPVGIEEIMKEVVEHFDTTLYNVYNSLLLSTDFTLFRGKRFGLSTKDYPGETSYVRKRPTQSTFDNKFSKYKEFVETHKRHPFAQGVPEESALKSWQHNVLTDIVHALPEQKSAFMEYLEMTSELPFTSPEYRFKNMCEKYGNYVKTHKKRPSVEEEPEMSKWFRKAAKESPERQDNRKKYFERLNEEISAIISCGVED